MRELIIAAIFGRELHTPNFTHFIEVKIAYTVLGGKTYSPLWIFFHADAKLLALLRFLWHVFRRTPYFSYIISDIYI